MAGIGFTAPGGQILTFSKAGGEVTVSVRADKHDGPVGFRLDAAEAERLRRWFTAKTGA